MESGGKYSSYKINACEILMPMQNQKYMPTSTDSSLLNVQKAQVVPGRLCYKAKSNSKVVRGSATFTIITCLTLSIMLEWGCTGLLNQIRK
jgi:hypothetical protein